MRPRPVNATRLGHLPWLPLLRVAAPRGELSGVRVTLAEDHACPWVPVYAPATSVVIVCILATVLNGISAFPELQESQCVAEPAGGLGDSLVVILYSGSHWFTHSFPPDFGPATCQGMGPWGRRRQLCAEGALGQVHPERTRTMTTQRAYCHGGNEGRQAAPDSASEELPWS